MTQTKHRPYFTDLELLEIIKALNERQTPARIKLITYLESFRLKIERGILSPALTLKIKETIEDRLELSTGTLKQRTLQEQESENERCYNKYRDPSQTCSPRELKRALDYAYLNDLLTPQEEEEYERTVSGSSV